MSRFAQLARNKSFCRVTRRLGGGLEALEERRLLSVTTASNEVQIEQIDPATNKVLSG